MSRMISIIEMTVMTVSNGPVEVRHVPETSHQSNAPRKLRDIAPDCPFLVQLYAPRQNIHEWEDYILLDLSLTIFVNFAHRRTAMVPWLARSSHGFYGSPTENIFI